MLRQVHKAKLFGALRLPSLIQAVLHVCLDFLQPSGSLHVSKKVDKAKEIT